MSGKLKQIQVTYDTIQDRILLRMNTSDQAEFSVWMTRRFVMLAWPALVNLLSSAADIGVQSTPEAKKAVLAFQHESAIEKADFSKKYEEDAVNWPLGKEPMLIMAMDIRRLGPDQHSFSFRPADGRQFQITLSRSTIHSLCKLVQDAARKADWGLKLEFLDAPPPEARPVLQ